MGLIKAARVPGSVTAFSMADIEQSARGILLRARQQAEQLLAAAQAESEAIKAQARSSGLIEGKKEGFAAGFEEGRRAGTQQALAEQKVALQQAVEALNAAARSLNAGRGALDAEATRDVVKLAIAIANKITKRQSLIEPGVLIANLEQAAKLVIQQSDVRVCVHPSQRKTLEESLPLLALSLPVLQHVEVIEDSALAPGGCRIRTRQGEIDATLDTQLARIVNDLLPAEVEASA